MSQTDRIMKYLILVVLFFTISITSSSAQSDDGGQYFLHKVQQGETLYSISKNYSVEQKELLNANPELISGLKLGQELKIPGVKTTQLASVQTENTEERLPIFRSYKVKRKNTLHGIAKQYDIEVDDILKYNPEAKNGIKKGQVLRIPDKSDLEEIKEEAARLIASNTSMISHIVVGDETLYSISNKYNCSISSILEINPDAKNGLPIGMTLQIPLALGETSQTIVADQYFVHLVESGETYWGLEKRYNTTQAELESLNPALVDGLKSGMRINIPLDKVPNVTAVPVNEEAFERYEVSKGETLYNISRRFNLKISEIKRVNPVLEYRGLMANEIILIPIIHENIISVQQDSINVPVDSIVVPIENLDYSIDVITTNVPEACEPNLEAAQEKYQIGLLLPLYLAANDTVNRIRITVAEMMEDTALMNSIDDVMELPVDSFRWRQDEIIYSKSENFLHFYEGVLLAVDSLQRQGMNVELNVFDTNQDKHVVDSLIQLDVFRELDLIIGPVYPEIQSSVANFAYKNRIPMVSPLSSSGNIEESNPYYFKVNPTKEYLIRKTADFINEEYFDKKLIVLQMGEYKHLPEVELVDLCREKFFNAGLNWQTDNLLFHEYNFQAEGSLGLSRVVSKDRNNIFIIPSSTEAQLSVGITNLNTLAEHYPVTLVGLSNIQRYNSIQIEYLHRINLTLLSPYFVDYKSKITNRFIGEFRTNFGTEPTQYSFQGYDIAFYFMSALYTYGKDFVECLPYLDVDLTQTNFSFDKVSRMGGYMNNGLFIVNYDPQFNVSAKGRVGKPTDYISAELK